MNWENIVHSKIVENLGWTLAHSLWQIGLVAFVLFLLLQFTKKLSANFRYLISVFALVVSFGLPVVTYVHFAGNREAGIFTPKTIRPTFTEESIKENNSTENYRAPVKLERQSSDSINENVFGSIENLRGFFANNFPAVLPFLVGLWFAGITIFSFRLCGGAWQLHRYRTRQISAPGAEWQKRFASLCEHLKINRSVKLLRSNLIETPIISGWLKPVILVPASVFLQINPRELETIITHELIHIRRYDAPVNFAQSIVEVLFFYHPCVWWISSAIRREREFAVDEAVIKTFGAERLVYANALANLEAIRQTANLELPPLATAANGGNLMQRISKILQKNQKNTEISQSSSAWSALLALAFISAIVLGVFSPGQRSFVNAQTATKNKKLAIGFVSIPPLDRTANPPKDSDATIRLMIAKLVQHQIPAIGFVQGGMISDGEKFYPVRANMVRLWRDAGLEVGVGGYKHIWFYHTPYDEYVANTKKNEGIVRKILAETNQSPRYFSYPFLNTGKSTEDKNKFENWLAARGLSSVKYTMDNQEWMYSYAYDQARNDNDLNTMNEIRREFLDYMSKMFDHYEAYSREMFGRDINQTLVLTPSRLIADSADELFGMIVKRGYKFVAMDEAQSDEAYQTPEDFTGKAGISWFERWQLAKGKKLRDEPKVAKLVEDTWENGKNKIPPPPPPPAPPLPPEPPAVPEPPPRKNS
ncbi:MAG TPA: M56 family metallopeptidase [Pyrinomonadaceae bacterium]|jgi:beta-lactamase regulating signal transducer with metallopeptidase domain